MSLIDRPGSQAGVHRIRKGPREEVVAAKIPVQWKRDEMPKCTNTFARDMRRVRSDLGLR
jgi:hypothetical protein